MFMKTWNRSLRSHATAIFAAVTISSVPISTAQSGVAASQAAAIKAYPELAVRGSKLNALFLDKVKALQAANDPILQTDDWPMQIASQLASASPDAKEDKPQLADTRVAAAAPVAENPASAPPGKIEKIEGAFGKRLGDAFEPNSALGKGAMKDGTPMYEFTPQKPFRSFTKYYVLITPRTKRIYSIWGVGPTENTETGEKEQAVLMQILEGKYGPSEKEIPFISMDSIKQISHGSRLVLTKVEGIIDPTIQVRYYDDDLTTLAEKERVSIEGKKVDSSGL
jgi:hypothetical protein